MVTEKKLFLNSILAAIDRELTALSFRKSADVYLKELGKDVQGWAGINLSTHLPNNRVGLSPFVGVIYSPIEDRGRVLSAQSFPSGPTLSVSVGYLTPEKRFLEWVFAPEIDVDSELAKITKAIRQYGLPFMQEHTSIDTIIRDLEGKRFTVNDIRRYRLPVAYLLAGRKHEALKFVEQEVEAMKKRSDPAAARYRVFAQAVRER